jgi:hypothetical protein
MAQEDYFSKGMLPPEMGIEVADGVMQNLNPQLRPEVDGLTSDISGQLADITDEELTQIINSKFFTFNNVLNNTDTVAVLFRILNLARDLEKSDKIIKVIWCWETWCETDIAQQR